MANTINNINEVGAQLAKMAADELKDTVQFAKSIDQAPASDYDGKNGYKAGQTIQISKPARFTPVDSFDVTSAKEDIVEETTPLTLDIQSTVSFENDSLEYAYKFGVGEAYKRFIQPAVSAIAQDIETKFLEKAVKGTYNVVGTPGSNGYTIAEVLAARTRMNKGLTPKDNQRFLLLESEAGAKAVDARSGKFQDASEIAKQYRDGMIGRADGFNWLENEMLPVITNGTHAGTTVVKGASQTGSSLIVDGFAAAAPALKKGQVFTIAGVYAVHPQTKATLNHLQQFVVTADVTGSSNEATIAISPAIVTSGSTQTVSAGPADNASVSFLGSASTAYTNNLAFHKSAFRMVSVPLIMPTNAEMAAQESVDGFNIAIVKDFDVNKRSMVTRLDFLGGLALVREEFATRIIS